MCHHVTKAIVLQELCSISGNILMKILLNFSIASESTESQGSPEAFLCKQAIQVPASVDIVLLRIHHFISGQDGEIQIGHPCMHI